MKYIPESKEEKRRKATELLVRLGLGGVLNNKTYTLSGGEQQRVALARCVLKPGKLILADEPTGALDNELANTVLEEMLQLQLEFHKTLVIVTHDLRVAKRCGRVLQLSVQ